MKVNSYIPPEKFTNTSPIYMSVFLAGTIDNGLSDDWQSLFINKLQNYSNSDTVYDEILVFNPRRADWNKSASYKQQEEQIIWELEYLDFADIIVMNILPDSKSPISLMEIGLYANSGKLFVFCQEDFYRYSNVKTVCEKYNIPLYNTNNIDEIINIILK